MLNGFIQNIEKYAPLCAVFVAFKGAESDKTDYFSMYLILCVGVCLWYAGQSVYSGV